MKRFQRWILLACAVLLPSAAILGQGTVTGTARFDQQIRASAALNSRPVRPVTAPAIDAGVRHANAPVVGAVVGAVALPTAGYLILHNRDSGSVNAGGLLLIAAIGAALGYIVGLAIRGH